MPSDMVKSYTRGKGPRKTRERTREDENKKFNSSDSSDGAMERWIVVNTVLDNSVETPENRMESQEEGTGQCIYRRDK